MPKVSKSSKRAREPSFEESLNAVLSATDEEPATRLILASQLFHTADDAPDYFEKTKAFVASLDKSIEADRELSELYEEYAAKTEPELADEVKELKTSGVLKKKEAKAIMQVPMGERKRMLFARILVIAMESEDGNEVDSKPQDTDSPPEIDELFIAGLTEAQCAERPQDSNDEAAVNDLAEWVCSLPTSELQEMCKARGIEWKSVPDGQRLPLVRGLLNGMLEAEAALGEESDEGEESEGSEEDEDEDEEDEEGEGEEDDDEEEENDDEDGDDDEDDDEEEEQEGAGTAEGSAKSKKTAGSGSAGGSGSADSNQPGECKQQ